MLFIQPLQFVKWKEDDIIPIVSKADHSHMVATKEYRKGEIMSDNIENLLNKVGLYEEIDLLSEDYTTIEKIAKGEYKARFYCSKCKMDSIFQSIEIAVKYKQKLTLMALPYNIQKNYEEIDLRTKEDSLKDYTKSKIQTLTSKFNSILLLNFTCAMHEEEIYTFVLKVENKKIQKIGQYPSVATIEQKSFKNFRKELGNYYPELTKAIGLAAHGIGIGSVVYLRRIIEFLVEEVHQEARYQNDNWDDVQYMGLHFDQKIKALENHLPKFFVDNRNTLYSVVSKAIHELTEDECIRLFPLLYKSIETIVSIRIADREEKEREKELTKMLGKEYQGLQ